MTGWIVATAATAALGAGGGSNAGRARHQEQSAAWETDALARAEQAVRVFGGGQSDWRLDPGLQR